MISKRYNVILWMFLLVGIFLPGDAFSASSKVHKGKHIEVALVSDTSVVVPGSDVWVGIHQKIEDQWHTYWKNPGDSGLKPTVKWTLPKGVKASALHWPMPHRIRVKHLVNYGYDKQVLLLSKLQIPKDWSKPTLEIQAVFTWLVCKEECIPGKATLTLVLKVHPKDKVVDEFWSKAATQLLQSRPSVVPGMKLKISVVKESLALRITGVQQKYLGFPGLTFYPLTPSMIHNAEKQKVTIKDGVLTFVLKKSPYFGSEGQQLDGWIVAENPTTKARVGFVVGASLTGKSVPALVKKKILPRVSKKASVRTADVVPLSKLFAGWKSWNNTGQDKKPMTLWSALLFALLGGLILNLMPCVFPILSIKILHFVEQSKEDAGSVRRHGLAFLLGVQFSFTLLAATLIGLRASGALIGWGFQLQYPTVIFALAVVMFVMGLSLSGLFEVGSSLMNVGDSLASRSGYTGSFFSGVLATIVATPCTAPFMGASIAFALTQPVWAGLFIFNALGFGMALPYFLLSSFPKALQWMPRPGAWMETVKQVMAFPLYAAAVWLLWVLGKQTGQDGIITALIMLVTISFGCWLFGSTRMNRLRWLATLSAILLVGGSLWYGVTDIQKVARRYAIQTQLTEKAFVALGARSDAKSKIEGSSYNENTFADLIRKKEHLFLNITAAWCISCKVNEKVALRSAAVKDALKKYGVRYVVGDWTQRQDDLTRVLEYFKRSGVPLYVLFHSKRKRFLILPQVLTPGIVTGALKKLYES